MIKNLLLLWLAAFPMMGSPGPATISLAGIGTAFGFRRSAAYLAGIISGTLAVLAMIAAGVTALLLAVPALVTVLMTASAAYIVYLAWRIASAPVGATRVTDEKRPSFAAGFILAIANPKAFAAIGSVYSGHDLHGADLAVNTVAKIAALAFVIVAVNAAWLAFGSAFSHILTDARSGRVASMIFAAMLLVSAASMLTGY